MLEQDERERPDAWLTAVEARGLAVLFDDSVSLAMAAHRLARARSRIRSSFSVPNDDELLAATKEIAAAVGMAVPALGVLRAECEARGFPVVARRAA